MCPTAKCLDIKTLKTDFVVDPERYYILSNSLRYDRSAHGDGAICMVQYYWLDYGLMLTRLGIFHWSNLQYSGKQVQFIFSINGYDRVLIKIEINDYPLSNPRGKMIRSVRRIFLIPKKTLNLLTYSFDT